MVLQRKWKSKEQLQFFEDAAKHFNIRSPKEWRKVSILDFKKIGGTGLLYHHKWSIFKALQDVYPNIKWNPLWFNKAPQGFWKNEVNQRNFLDEFAKKFNLNQPSDWESITVAKISENGGSGLLNHFGYSLMNALRKLYPGTNKKAAINPLEKNWDLKNSVNKKLVEYRRRKLEKIAKELNIKKPIEWAFITTKEIVKYGGKSILRNYNFSRHEMLSTIFPEMEWNEEWFESRKLGYWKDLKNQRNFFESIANKLHIQHPKDWGRITQDRVSALGGNSLLKQYGNSLLHALEKVYPNITWKKEWFVNIPKYRSNHWNSISNQKSFLYKISFDYGIEDPNQWRRLTYALIKKKGGSGLLARYNNSLTLVLNNIYGENWSESPTFSNTQRRLNAIIANSQ